MHTVNDRTRTAVWIGLLNSERQMRYYGKLSKRHGNRSTAALTVLAILGIAEVAFVFADPAGVLVAITGVVIGALATWAQLGQDAKKAATLHSISIDCRYITLEMKALWDRIDDPDQSDDEVYVMHQGLMRRLLASTSRAGDVDIHEDEKLNEKCWDESCTVLENQYAI